MKLFGVVLVSTLVVSARSNNNNHGSGSGDGGKYWWMDQQGVFGGQGRGSSSGGHSGSSSSGGHSGSFSQPQQFNNNGGFQQHNSGSISKLYFKKSLLLLEYNNNFILGSNTVQTECPAGTKCVSEYFCDANAILVDYRVDLTAAQKRKRGQLPVS